MRLSAVALVAPSALILFAALRGSVVHASDHPARYGLRLEAGAEFDSNPARREIVAGAPSAQVAASPATRVAVAADIDQPLGARFVLSAAAGVAARRLLRPESEGEDLVVSDAHASFGHVGTGWSLAAVGALYDVEQRADSIEQARDFRSLSAGGRALLQVGQNRLHAAGGWRWFAFKPERAFDFAGPTAALGYRRTPRFTLDGSAEWEYGLQAALESRRFAQVVCAGAGCPPGSPVHRQDRFFSVDSDVTRTADQLFGFGLSLQHNDSARFGETLSRLLGHLRLVCLLPWELSLAVRAELVATRYADPVPVGHNSQTDAFITIEDEGRSSLRIDLSRPMGGRLEGGLRYTFYTQTPISGPVRFSRHLGFAYLALSLGR